MPASTATRRAHRGGTTRREEQLGAQPDHAPVPPYAPAPGAPAELLAQLRADRRAERWVPAFDQEWATALEESPRTSSLAALYEVVQVWQARIASAPAVDAFLDSGRDETGFVDLARGEMVWDVLDAAAADPWGFRQWDTGDPEGDDVRIDKRHGAIERDWLIEQYVHRRRTLPDLARETGMSAPNAAAG